MLQLKIKSKMSNGKKNISVQLEEKGYIFVKIHQLL